MNNEEAYELIGKRVEEIIAIPKIQEKMLSIAKTEGKEKAVQYAYLVAIATLVGI